MRIKRCIFAGVVLFGLSSGVVDAQTDSYRYYGYAAGQQSWLNAPADLDDTGLALAGGVALSPQWRLEFGAEQLAKGAVGYFSALPAAAVADLDAQAITLSVLGFSHFAGPTQLFYRVGISRTELDHQQPVVVSSVALEGKVMTSLQYQDVSQSRTQVQFGLGVEHAFDHRWFGRAEWVHLMKKDNFDSNSLRLGIGYRF